MDPYPHHFSSHREAPDSLRVEGWNEDGTHEVTVRLSHASALDLIAVLARAVSENPYAR